MRVCPVFSQTMKSFGGTTENKKALEKYWQKWEIEFSGQNLDAEIVRVGPFFQFPFSYYFLVLPLPPVFLIVFPKR